MAHRSWGLSTGVKTDMFAIFVRSPAGPLPISRVPGQFPRAVRAMMCHTAAPNSPGVFIRPLRSLEGENSFS